ncbi:hypothetical protein F3J23_14355 [Chryseobacterium sp. Tr-659]|uniref:PKD domain-containing protein n=1 Tax=Chryseobacterium sp. Tr-659 TaxID=2608340 RepID=UPI00141E7DA6|nr:hypothetical protein [Chryseobacterium sp. Tr-659]NIF06628.1 hypothetical protein [Chryseobacterium sp. Tr-659]
MNNQLSNIAVQYRKFSKGQYIEHKQFNEFLDFFEDQDRLSRVLLQGVGIVCGLKPNLIYTNQLLSGIELSQGVGLTTDGDLLTLNKTSKVSEDLYVSDLKTIKVERKNYTHFKTYDNFKVKYPAFYDGSDKQIELWELATDEEANSSFQPLSNLSNLDDKYLLLYLEDYEKEVKPCRGVDCDNHGIQQIRNLKVLVTTSAGISNILGKDRIQSHPLFIKDILEPVKQERVIVERLILERGVEANFLSSDLKKIYTSVLEKNGYGESIFKKITAICQIMGLPTGGYKQFRDRLEKHLTQRFGFQYAYDVVQDLMDTYSEIIKLLPKAFTKCFPDFLSFPKHIMLGKLLSSNQIDPGRHQFYNSPVLDDEKATQKVIALINRFNQQVQNFRVINPPDAFKGQIQITPSKRSGFPGNKAVPFYYQITDEFLKTWNFDKTSNRSFKTNLAYDRTMLSSNEYVQYPLNFNLDKYSFYNIEGHQGMDYQKAFDLIKEIRDKQQLGFDIMVLSLEELVNNQDVVKAYFNEYLEKHPGLEHKRGVEGRGTFAMVYDPVGRVIADFSLPYMCCTPKTKIQLSLPNTVICAQSRPIPFTVLPLNGVVKAAVDGSLNGGVQIINGKYFFDPASVSPQLYGQEITFTVNGVPTSCSIKVTAQPKVKIVANSVDYPEGSSPATTVNFKVSGDDFASYNYSWDFLGNGSFVTMNPDAKGNLSYTFYNLTPPKIPTIRVSVGNNGCTQDIEINNWYVVPDITIKNINFPKGNCCEGYIPPTIIANAGGNQTISLPINFVTLWGSGSGASNLIYKWSQISGPGATLNGENQATLQVTDLVDGVYQFELMVQDPVSGVLATDIAQIAVLSLPSKPELEVIVKPVYNQCEAGMVVRVNVPRGQVRLVKVFKKGTVSTNDFKNYSGIKNFSDVIVYDGFEQKIEVPVTFGMFLNVNGFIYGQQTDTTILTLQITDDSGAIHEEVELKANHNVEFNSKEMNRCLS